ncbi:MAG: class C sortase [Veillonella sp.]|nr:class C sortase [Veillonella sp.]
MRNKKNKKFTLSNCLLFGLFILGFCLLTYPIFANWWNTSHAIAVIDGYDQAAGKKTQEQISSEFEKANKYNKELWDLFFPLNEYREVPGYEDILNVDGSGLIGYVTIDKISVKLPIYHGTDSNTLSSAVGHLEGTSLPTGEIDTHVVLSAHRGLPSAKLFTDIDRLREGDLFTVTVLNKVFTYEVDQIRIVKPNEVNELYLEEGKSYCTLLTCTPYGINTERLLVRGHITKAKPGVLTNEAIEMDSLILSPILFVLLIVLLLWVLAYFDKKRKTRIANASNPTQNKTNFLG